MTTTITVLAEKGSPLSHTEMDNNFRALRNLVEVPTVAALRALGDGAIPVGDGTVLTHGCLSADDDGGGLWRWDADATAADNAGTVVLPTGHVGNGRWVRVTSGEVVSPTWWGFSASATAAQNAAALQAALDAGVHIQTPAGTFDYNTTLTLPTGGRITGAGMRATTLHYTGTGFAITFAVGGCIENVKLTGNTNSDGAITLANCGLGEIKSVDISSFKKAGAIAIKLDECYRIKLSYLFLYDNSNGIVLSGNITAFEFDKGNVAVCSEYALKQTAGNTDLRINGVYFESNYGINPIYIAVYGVAYFNGCAFEDNCGTSGSNPKVIQVDNPCRLELVNCGFSPLTAVADTFTGAAYAIYSDNAPSLRVVNCETAENYAQAGLPVYFCRVFGRAGDAILHFENNRFYGSRFTTDEEAEAYAFGGFDHLYFPQKFTSINNLMRYKTHTRLPSLYSQSGGSTASTGTAYTYWTRTFNKKSHSNGFIVKILAWGRRTGAGGNQKITLTLTEIGGAAPTVINVTPNSTEANWRTEIVINWHVYNGQRVSVFAMDGATPSISNTLTTLNTSAYDFSIALGAVLASGTDVTYLDGMAVTLE